MPRFRPLVPRMAFDPYRGSQIKNIVRPGMFDSASMCVQECLIVRPCAFDLWGNVVTVGADDVDQRVLECVIVPAHLVQISMFLCVNQHLMFQMCLA